MEPYVWKAITTCDSSYDGIFFYGVTSTKIYCRPSCKSREPKIEHVKIFSTTEEPRTLGFRPCKRCRPDDMSWKGADDEILEKTKQYILQNYKQKLTLTIISDELAVNPYHLHRTFKKAVGRTPIEYLQDVRLGGAIECLLHTDDSTTEIAFNHGFSSLSHFSSVFKKSTGFSPSAFRKKKAAIP